MKKVSKPMRKMEAADKPEMTAGLDLGDRYSRYCLLNAEGDVVEEGRIQSTEAALRRHFEGEPEIRVALDCGAHSPWVSRWLASWRWCCIVCGATQSASKPSHNRGPRRTNFGRWGGTGSQGGIAPPVRLAGMSRKSIAVQLERRQQGSKGDR